MKKIISIVLSLIIVFTALYFPCSDIIKEKVTLSSILKTSQKLNEISRKYDDEYFNDDDCTYIKKRLVIKTDNKLDEYGAIESVYDFGYAFLQYDTETAANSAYSKYKAMGLKPEYDEIITACGEADYASRSDEWSYEETDVDAILDYYKAKIKPTINVAVLDSGINYNHELFKNRVTRTNVNFATDGNANDEIDTFGHGTHVSGVIAKCTPSNVKLSSYRVFNTQGKGTTSQTIPACEYICNLSKKPEVINLSIRNENTTAISKEINMLTSAGIYCVTASGNDNTEIYDVFGNADSVLTTAATGVNNKHCSFSNYGECVDIAAPGEHILSAAITGNSDYQMAKGTSFAAPFITSAVAYALMDNKNYTHKQIKDKIIESAKPFKKSDCQILYGAGIVNFSNMINGTRCKPVTANLEGGVYRENISVELACENTLVDIYYTTDGSLPTKDRGIKYTEPITLSEPTRIIAAAYARAGTPVHSKFTVVDYYVFKNGESEFIIDRNGYIIAYLGNDKSVTVPSEIDGIEAYSIGAHCFENSTVESIEISSSICGVSKYAFKNSNLKSISASDVSGLATGAFYGCEFLTDINLPKLRDIGSYSFYGCNSLNREIEFPGVETLFENAFTGSSFSSIKLPSCTIVKNNAFEACPTERIILNKAASIGKSVFLNCRNLKILYAPLLESVGGFDGCESLEILFVPKCRDLSEDIRTNVVVFIYKNWMDYYPVEYTGYTIVAPLNSVANYSSINKGYNYIDSLQTSFTGIDGGNFVYTCSTDGQSVKVPVWLVNEMWYDYLPINRTPDFMDHGYLIDVVPDKIINAKDFARIYHTN